MDILRLLIAFIREHYWCCEVVQVGEFREFLWVSFDLILHARIGVPADSIQARTEERNEAEGRAD